MIDVRRRLLLITVLACIVGCDGRQVDVAPDSGPVSLPWVKRFLDASFADVAVDKKGNIHCIGGFNETTSFGGKQLKSVGGADIALASFSSVGAHLWSKSFGSDWLDGGGYIRLDPDGNLIIVGIFSKSVDFGGGPLTSAGNLDVYIASYSPSGAHRWSKRFGSKGEDFLTALEVDRSGNLFMTGTFNGSADFGGGPLTSVGKDLYLVSYSAKGAHRWSRRFGGAGKDYGFGLAPDDKGNVVLVAQVEGAVDFGGGAPISAGAAGLVLAAYDAKGTHRWSKALASSGAVRNVANQVTAHPPDRFYVSGYFEGTADYGGGTLTSAGSADAFVAAYDFTGGHTWSKRFGAAGVDEGKDMALDAKGNLLLSGSFEGAVDFGGGALTSKGRRDIFITSIDPAGAHVWSRSLGGADYDSCNAVVPLSSGAVLLGGSFRKTVDFAGTTLTAKSEDAFLFAFKP